MFSGLGDRMQFAVLDVESDAVEQGFEEASYDLCIAVNVSGVLACLVADR